MLNEGGPERQLAQMVRQCNVRTHLWMDDIQGSDGSKDRKGIVEHFVGDALGDIADVYCQGVLLLYSGNINLSGQQR